MRADYNGTNINELTTLETMAGGLKGYWLKEWGICKLTVVRGHAMLSSNIADTQTSIEFTLPKHKPFYILLIGSTGIRRVLIESNVNITLNAGEQIQAIFTVEA